MINMTMNLLNRPSLANQILTYHSTDNQSFDDGSIEYKFNSLGYRTQEFDQFKPENFFLALGCSYTEGIGLRDDQIWCNQLAERLGIKCMNLGLGGTGIEIVHAITTQYVRSNLPKPKMVIVQHSELDRHTSATLTHQGIHLDTSDNTISWRTRIQQEYHYDVCDITDMWRCSQLADAVTWMWNQIGVPVIHWTFSTDGENYLTSYQVHEYPATMCPEVEMLTELARDQSHSGAGQHREVAKYLYNQCNDLAGLNQPQQYNNQVDSVQKVLQDRILSVISGDHTNMTDVNQDSQPEQELNVPDETNNNDKALEQEEEMRKRIEELRRRDPFVYK